MYSTIPRPRLDLEIMSATGDLIGRSAYGSLREDADGVTLIATKGLTLTHGWLLETMARSSGLLTALAGATASCIGHVPQPFVLLHGQAGMWSGSPRVEGFAIALGEGYRTGGASWGPSIKIGRSVHIRRASEMLQELGQATG